jgi:hypothetical protein
LCSIFKEIKDGNGGSLPEIDDLASYLQSVELPRIAVAGARRRQHQPSRLQAKESSKQR